MGATEATVLLVAGALAAFGVLFVMGANDVANAIGIALSSGALSSTGSFVIAGIFEFLGAWLGGKRVSASIASSISPGLAERVDKADGKRIHQNTKGRYSCLHATRLILANVLIRFRGHQFGLPPSQVTVAFSYLCVLVSVVLVISVGTYFAIPLASTHAVVGGTVGVALLSVGAAGISWRFVWDVGLAWIISPLFGGAVAFIVRYVLAIAGRSYGRYRAILPVLSALTVSGFVNLLLILGPPFIRLGISKIWQTCVLEALLFLSTCFATATFMTRYTGGSVNSFAVYNLTEDEVDGDGLKHVQSKCLQNEGGEDEIEMTIVNASSLSGNPEDADMESGSIHDPWQGAFVLDEQAPIFRLLLAITAASVAFAHGSNDVSNGIGPFVGILRYFLIVVTNGRNPDDATAENTHVSELLWTVVLASGATAIVAGLLLFGHAVIRTIGSLNRRGMTYARGFSAQFAASVAVLTASTLGIPLSTSHCVVAAAATASVAFVPAAEKAPDGLDVALLWRIALYAIVTPFASALLAVVLRLCLRILVV